MIDETVLNYATSGLEAEVIYLSAHSRMIPSPLCQRLSSRFTLRINAWSGIE